MTLMDAAVNVVNEKHKHVPLKMWGIKPNVGNKTQ